MGLLSQMVMESVLDEKIRLDFGEYKTLDSKKPEGAGICWIYRADSKGQPKELVYIAETGRIENLLDELAEMKNDDRQVVYCFAPVKRDKNILLRAKAALIFEFKPECNENGKDNFNYGKTEITINGGKFPYYEFTVDRRERS